jgi:thymidylate kinase
MTRSDKKAFVRKTQSQIIEKYQETFSQKSDRMIEIDGIRKTKEIALSLKNQVLDMII